MILGYEIRSKGLENINPISVSDVSGLMYFTPLPSPSEPIACFTVVVSYRGNLIRSDNFEIKRVFNPKHKIGRLDTRDGKNTHVTYLFPVKDPFFAEDAYHDASNFQSLMMCRIKNENTK